MLLTQTGDFHSVREAERIYLAIFGGDVPGVIAQRFAAASARLDATAPEEELAAYRQAITRVRDLEALEVAGRYTGRHTLLSRKFRLMVYLAETIPENRSRFIADRDARLAGWLSIVAGGVRTAWKLAKGLVIARRVRRV